MIIEFLEDWPHLLRIAISAITWSAPGSPGLELDRGALPRKLGTISIVAIQVGTNSEKINLEFNVVTF